MAVGGRVLGAVSASGKRSAAAAASLDSRNGGSGVEVVLPGLVAASVYVSLEDVTAWPTDLVLTVLRRVVLPGVWRALPTPTTISGVGVTAVTAVGGAASGVRVQVSTPSTAGHGRVRVGVVAESVGLAGYEAVEDEGVSLARRPVINFTGAGVSVADSGGKTVVTVSSGGGGLTEADALALVVFGGAFA